MSLQISQPDAASELLSRRKARSSLLEFTLYTKPDYEVNWHHQLLCDYLDKFASGEITRLMVFMPPRHGKSELGSRRLPAYLMGKNPECSIISCSYSADLASRMNRDVQRIIDTPRYQKLFPDTTLSGENIRTNAQGAYLRNSDIFEVIGHRGVYRSSGVGGGITGMGCNFGIIDDPIKNREEAASATYREKTWEWYTSTFYTRLEKDAQILLIMTRWHEDDLAARIIKHSKEEGGENWKILKLPALPEPGNTNDPRSGNEPLWENKFNTSRLEAIRQVIGPYQWASLYQQRPAPIEGGLWKYATIERYRVKSHPPLIRIVVGVDPSVTATTSSDDTGIIVGGIGTDHHGYALGDYTVHGSPHEWALGVARAFRRHQSDLVVGEVNNGGDLVEVNLRTVDPNIPFKSVHASRGKQIRAEPVAGLYEQGRIHHVGTFPELEDQMCGWVPGQKSPDRMDALVWMFWELFNLGSDREYQEIVSHDTTGYSISPV